MIALSARPRHRRPGPAQWRADPDPVTLDEPLLYSASVHAFRDADRGQLRELVAGLGEQLEPPVANRRPEMGAGCPDPLHHRFSAAHPSRSQPTG
jgi:hypothetical protein